MAKEDKTDHMEEFINKLNQRFESMDKDIKYAVDMSRAAGPIMAQMAQQISALDLNTTLLMKYIRERDEVNVKEILKMTGETNDTMKAYLKELRDAYVFVNEMYRKTINDINAEERAEQEAKNESVATDKVPAKRKKSTK